MLLNNVVSRTNAAKIVLFEGKKSHFEFIICVRRTYCNRVCLLYDIWVNRGNYLGQGKFGTPMG